MCLEMDFKSRYSTQRTLAMQKLASPMSYMPRIDLGWLCSLANSHIPELLREQLLKLHIPCERAISAVAARRFARIDIGCYTRCLNMKYLERRRAISRYTHSLTS